MKYSALIADDELPGRQRLLDLIEDVTWIRCIGVATDGLEAIRLIDQLKPDLVFLDIRMPGASGVDVASKISHTPHVIFTTAYDRYAVTAFELNAVDYLLKPFSEERFVAAVDRVRLILESEGAQPASTDRARVALGQDPYPNRLFVRVRGKIVPLPVDDIVRLEAQGDYVMIHTETRQHLVHVRLKDLYERLDPRRFVRIHRSHVAGINRIASLEPYDGHRLIVALTDGTSLVSSKTGTKLLRQLVL